MFLAVQCSQVPVSEGEETRPVCHWTPAGYREGPGAVDVNELVTMWPHRLRPMWGYKRYSELGKN